VIGEGGTGRIHLARDEMMDREVALKIPLESILKDPAAREDVIRETRQAMDLTHPNIVRIHDFHEDKNHWGISMQYVRGKNLDEWRYEGDSGGLRRSIRPYSVETIRDWVAQICDALRYAHEDARMVHRDIKPKNLMMEKRDGGEKIYITDFGISQRLRQHTMMLSRDQSKAGENKGNMGTLPYMSWEQIVGAPASPLDDVYAVGATIYELITGRPPFFDGAFEQIKVQIREVVPPSMEQRMLDLGLHVPPPPPEWEQVVAACLAKKAEDRPQSIRAVAEALGFHTGSSTELEARIHTQAERINDLEYQIIQFSQGTAAQYSSEELSTASSAEVARLNEENRQFREQAEQWNQLLSAAARKEGEMQTMLDRLQRERDVALQGGDSALRDFQEEAQRKSAEWQKKITELEQTLQKARTDSNQLVTEKTEQMRKELLHTQEKLGASERDKEQAISQIRAEAEKRLHGQAQDLEKMRQQWQKAAERVEQLDRAVATEKERQGASLRPALLTLCVAAALGLIGGVIHGKLRSSPADEPLKDELVAMLPTEMGKAAGEPVSFEFFEEFAKAMNSTAENMGAKKGDKGQVTHVNAVMAMNFCNWLNQKRPAAEGVYSLPSYEILSKTKPKPENKEWTDDWSDQQISALKVYDVSATYRVHASHAADIGFRVALEKP
jgi:serine/threonine protein kinase